MKRVITIFVLMAACVVSAQLTPSNPPANVVLAWDASPSGEVTGYRVYWGAASRCYTNVLATTNLIATVTNLQRGVTYYFAVTAFTATGLESEFSNEVSYTAPARPVAPILRLSMAASRELQGRGEPYQTYRIERTTDLAVWVAMTTVTADGHGTFTASDPGPSCMAAFYRTAL